MAKKILKREHPALFLGEEREDLERICVVDGNGKKTHDLIRDIASGEVAGETLIPYPNDAEFEIVED